MSTDFNWNSFQAREVQTVFPSIDLTSIIEDLRSTHSVEITINNILEGRLVILVCHFSSDFYSCQTQNCKFHSRHQLLTFGYY